MFAQPSSLVLERARYEVERDGRPCDLGVVDGSDGLGVGEAGGAHGDTARGLHHERIVRQNLGLGPQHPTLGLVASGHYWRLSSGSTTGMLGRTRP